MLSLTTVPTRPHTAWLGSSSGYVAGCSRLRIFDQNYHLLATHERATRPGRRGTHLDHQPAEKVPGLMLNREVCQKEATEIGPATAEIVQILLADPVVDR